MFKVIISKTIIGFILLLSLVSVKGQNVSMPNIFGSNMVLQQNTNAPFWGWAAPNSSIEINAEWGAKAKTVTGSDGKWKTTIKTPVAIPGKMPKYLVTVKGQDNTLYFEDVQIGEVWVCGGQSNMTYHMKYLDSGMQGVVDYEKEIKEAKYPSIKLFTVERATPSAPATNCNGSWKSCSPSSIAGFSAPAYYFGRQLFLNKSVNVPIGLILDAVSGSSIQAWIKKDTLLANPELRTKYILPKPKDANGTPSLFYNGMIAPIIPYAIKGFIWYQGESNAGDGRIYGKANIAMLRDWRKDWGYDFSFYAVQLTPRLWGVNPKDVVYGRALFREWQSMVTTEPNTGIIVTSDLLINKEEVGITHTRNKKDVGIRLANWALAKDYGQHVQYLGPVYASHIIVGDKVIIIYKPESLGSGLTTKDGGAVKCFKIAGADNVFYPAKAKIDGNTIIVSCDKVNNPVSVRYAVSDGAMTNLMNKEGIAAYPFRTDTLDKVTYIAEEELEHLN